MVRRRSAEAEREGLIAEQGRLRRMAEDQAATLASLLDQVPVGIMVLDNELRFARVNAYNTALCDAPPEELIGRTLDEVLTRIHGPDAAGEIATQFREVLATGKPFSASNWCGPLRHRPAAPYYADWSIRRIEGPAGESVGLLATAVEVTANVLREQALRASEQRFRTMADAVPVLIWVCDTRKQCTYLNRPWLDFTGLDMKQGVGEAWEASVHPEDRDRCRQIRAAALEARQAFEMVYRLRRTDGEYRAVFERGAPWMAADGNLLGYIGSGIDVTGQQRLEEQRNRLLEELEARNAFTEAILCQVPAGILVADARTGRIFLSNQEAERIIRGKFEPGHPMEDYDHLLDLSGKLADGTRMLPGDRPLVRALRHGEMVQNEEIELVCLDGTQLSISVNAAPVTDHAGRVVAAVAAFHDITDRKQAEQEIRQREDRFRYLADAMPQIVWIVNADGSLLYLNRRWQDYTGLTERETYQPGSWEEVVHPDDLERVQESWSRARDAGTSFECEYRLRDRDGNYRWFLGRSVRLRDDQGQVLSSFGTATDIDDRKRSEQAARFLADASAALATLADEESALKQIAQLAVPHFADWCAVDMADQDGQPRRLAVAHADPAKVALACDIHRCYPPRSESSSGVWAILRSGEPRLVPRVTEEMLAAHAEDSTHLERVRELGLRSFIGVPLPGRNGPLGVISFGTSESQRIYGPDDLRLAQDLAYRAAIAIENARLYEKLRQADRRKDEFLATLAHELRNPLAPIANALRLMGRSTDPDQERHRSMAERLVKHLARLVGDLVDVARINQGRIDLVRQVVELAPIVERVIENVGQAVAEREHALAVSLPGKPIWLHADPTRLEQVLWNLLNNAIRYTEPGGKISVSAHEENGEVVLRVRDAGIGIPPEMLLNVFEMFAHGENRLRRGQGGLGIGLGLARKLVLLHGGTITAQSDGPGLGSEFVIRLPLCPQTEPSAGSGTGREQPVPPESAKGHCRILVVDDNQDAADSLASLLMMLQGHVIQVAYDGPSALGLATTFEPHVIILDLGMPEMDGYEVARRLRADPTLRQARLLALSGWGQEKDREASLAAGFEHHLVKPVDFDLLRELLSQLAEDRSQQPDLESATR